MALITGVLQRVFVLKSRKIGSSNEITILWFLSLLMLSSSACTESHFSETPTPQTVYVGYNEAQPVPPGVVRYCWEEPVVEFQENGPGLDSEREWYVPASTAVRMVKQGRWRPCKPVESEIKGETKNER